MNENHEMTTALAVRELILPDRQTIQAKFVAIREFQALVQSQMIEGHDYGKIPGTTQPTLFKPGAEKLAKLLELDDKYDIVSQVENWDRPFFAYTVRCRLVLIANSEIEVSQGLGECNSYESKYRWRQTERACPACGKETIVKGRAEYGGGWLCWTKKGGCGEKFLDADKRIMEQSVGRVENEDICSQVNTLLKMAKKRALVDAALSAGRLSDIFTQDMEDLIEGEAREIPPEPAPHSPQGRTSMPRRAAAPRSAPARTAETAPEPDDLDPGGELGERTAPIGPSRPASEQQRAYIERLLDDVGLEYADLRAEDELRTLPEWDVLTVASVPLAVDWLLKRKRTAAAGAAHA